MKQYSFTKILLLSYVLVMGTNLISAWSSKVSIFIEEGQRTFSSNKGKERDEPYFGHESVDDEVNSENSSTSRGEVARMDAASRYYSVRSINRRIRKMDSSYNILTYQDGKIVSIHYFSPVDQLAAILLKCQSL